ncbi:MAG: cytochrome C [Campylobacterota bacterium]|nr:cytochrome C [Campylobacterota bacterium]
MLKSKILILLSLCVVHLNAAPIGSLLFHGNCITCHFETKDDSAPSIMSVRENYLRAFPKKKDFVAYMSTWVLSPNAEGSLMLDSIEKYELMPLLGYEESTLKIIAEYIYDTDFTQEHKGHKDRE